MRTYTRIYTVSLQKMQNTEHKVRKNQCFVSLSFFTGIPDPDPAWNLNTEPYIYPDPASDSGFIVVHFEDFIYLPNE